MQRRSFIRNTRTAAAAFGLRPGSIAMNVPPKNKLPEWKGFSLLDLFLPIEITREYKQPNINSGGCTTCHEQVTV